MEHKARSLILSALTFLALLLPLRFPAFFWKILVVAALGAGLGTFWVFDEKLNLRRFSEDWFTILFIFVYLIIGGVFAYLVPHPIVQALLLGAIGLSLYFLFLVASRLKRNYTPSLMLRNVTVVIAILAVFAAEADILWWAVISNLGYTYTFIIIVSLVSVFVVSEFLFEVHNVERSILYSLTLAFGVAQIVWLSSFWMIAYPYSERITNVGIPLPAIIGTVFFYLFWGLSQHRIEGNLTKRIMWEYILISGVFLSILFLTAKWLPA